ncbi:MAG: adenine phosphoribosyltransferase [Acidimicrobiales bacterium]|jgi:adenine phosphoribosyltransferase|nr:adenine phosphoribosyltransferase [Acidimicrobiales bacterium]
MATDVSALRGLIRDIPDHPISGVTFRDITPLLADPAALRSAVDAIAEMVDGTTVDAVVGIEARGFILAAPVAYRLGAGFVPVRKPGKLPWETVTESYELEYGTDSLEMHVDGVRSGSKVLIVDDVLATGGTASACARLVERGGGTVVGFGFLVEIEPLGGRARLDEEATISALIRYGGDGS